MFSLCNLILQLFCLSHSPFQPRDTFHRHLLSPLEQVVRLLYTGRPVLAAALACLSRLSVAHPAAVCDTTASQHGASAAVRRLTAILCGPRPSAWQAPIMIGGGYSSPAGAATVAAGRVAADDQVLAVQVLNVAATLIICVSM